MAKKNKNKEVKLAAEIKKMEEAKRSAVVIKPNVKIDFNSWYHQRKKQIPKQHLKEILWADFKARGISEQSTVEEFDKALELYGIEL